MDIFPTIESVKVASQGQFAFDVAPLPKGAKGRVNKDVRTVLQSIAPQVNALLESK